MRSNNKHIVFGQGMKCSFNYLYALIVFFIISSGNVLACHHMGQTSTVPQTDITVSKFTADSYSEVFNADSKHYSLDKKATSSNSGHHKDAENNLTQKTSYSPSSNLHTHKQANIDQSPFDLDCCIDNDAECSTTRLCECSYKAGKEVTSLRISSTKGVSGPLFTITRALSHKIYNVRLLSWAISVPHPSYFSLLGRWLL